MNINSYGEVAAIRFKHKGFEMNMEHILPAVYMEGKPVKPGTIAFFEYDDMREVEIMIRMLEEFKRRCDGKIGSWEIKI
jgi:hypothetical protein